MQPKKASCKSGDRVSLGGGRLGASVRVHPALVHKDSGLGSGREVQLTSGKQEKRLPDSHILECKERGGLFSGSAVSAVKASRVACTCPEPSGFGA